MNVYSLYILTSCFLLELSHGNSRYRSQCPYGDVYSIDSPLLQCASAPAQCPNIPFQSLDGSCNNLKHPDWGMAATRYSRLIPGKYGDNRYTIALAKSGRALPNARLLSMHMHSGNSEPDTQFTLINMQHGQVIAHDLSLKAGAMASLRNETDCCKQPDPNSAPLDKRCLPISIAADDPLYGPVNKECMHFKRTITDHEISCTCNGPLAEQLNIVTAYMDHSTVYGTSVHASNALRLFRGGQMQTSGDQLPKQASDAHDLCNVERSDALCLNSISDKRMNQSPDLALLQTIYQREHNRLAAALADLNPHWSDERLFQVARRINVATYQYVSYYECLPNVLGRQNMLEKGLIFENVAGRYVNDYDSGVKVATLNEHSTSAFRYFHSNVESDLQFVKEDRTPSCPVEHLRNWYYDPKLLSLPGNLDNMLRGMCTQPMQATDREITQDIHGFLFILPDGKPNLDLIAIDIQRGRDHGLASYSDYRVWAGLKRATCWEDFLDSMRPIVVDKLKEVYEHWDDCDMVVAGSAEIHVKNSQAGPVFLAIMLEQFRRSRQGDRFFFENGECEETRFTMDQLTEIRKASMARLVCDNSNVFTIQRKAFEVISNSNPLQRCSGIPRVDLRPWQECP